MNNKDELNFEELNNAFGGAHPDFIKELKEEKENKKQENNSNENELNEVDFGVLDNTFGGANPEFIKELQEEKENKKYEDNSNENELNEVELDGFYGGANPEFIREQGYFTEKQIKEVELPIEKKESFVKRALKWIHERVNALKEKTSVKGKEEQIKDYSKNEELTEDELYNINNRPIDTNEKER